MQLKIQQLMPSTTKKHIKLRQQNSSIYIQRSEKGHDIILNYENQTQNQLTEFTSFVRCSRTVLRHRFDGTPCHNTNFKNWWNYTHQGREAASSSTNLIWLFRNSYTSKGKPHFLQFLVSVLLLQVHQQHCRSTLPHSMSTCVHFWKESLVGVGIR